MAQQHKFSRSSTPNRIVDASKFRYDFDETAYVRSHSGGDRSRPLSPIRSVHSDGSQKAKPFTPHINPPSSHSVFRTPGGIFERLYEAGMTKLCRDLERASITAFEENEKMWLAVRGGQTTPPLVANGKAAWNNLSSKPDSTLHIKPAPSSISPWTRALEEIKEAERKRQQARLANARTGSPSVLRSTASSNAKIVAPRAQSAERRSNSSDGRHQTPIRISQRILELSEPKVVHGTNNKAVRPILNAHQPSKQQQQRPHTASNIHHMQQQQQQQQPWQTAALPGHAQTQWTWPHTDANTHSATTNGQSRQHVSSSFHRDPHAKPHDEGNDQAHTEAAATNGSLMVHGEATPEADKASSGQLPEGLGQSPQTMANSASPTTPEPSPSTVKRGAQITSADKFAHLRVESDEEGDLNVHTVASHSSVEFNEEDDDEKPKSSCDKNCAPDEPTSTQAKPSPPPPRFTTPKAVKTSAILSQLDIS